MSTLTRSYHVVIKPHQKWLYFDWRGLVQYRDLLFLLVRRDFISRYKQTVLGPAWFIVSPGITTLVYTVIFSRALGISTAGVPPVLFYLSGLMGWTYFSTVISTTATTFTASANLFGKVYFPRVVVPIALGMSHCITFAIQLTTFLVVLTMHEVSGRVDISLENVIAGLALTPFLLLHLALLGLGVGLTLSSVTAKYRDIQHLVPTLINLWMFASPVIYPTRRVPENLAWITELNPVAPVIEAFRHLYLGTPTMSLSAYAGSALFAVLLFTFGVLSFQRTARTVADIV